MRATVCPVCQHAKQVNRATCGRPKCWEVFSWERRGLPDAGDDAAEPPGNPGAAEYFTEKRS